MQGQRQGARTARRVEHGGPVPAGGVHEELPGTHGPGRDEALDQPGQGVVGDGEEHQLGPLQHLRGGEEGDAGQHPVGPAPGGVGHAGDGDGVVPGLLQGAGQRGPDAAGADDSDGEPGGALLLR